MMDKLKERIHITRMLPFISSFLVYLSSRVVAYGFGYKNISIEWNLWQLLDRSMLLEKPYLSLKFLHAQPPILNAVLSLILRASQILDVSEESIALGLFIVLGLAASFLIYQTLFSLTDSHAWATIGLTAFCFNPATWYFQWIFFYTFFLLVFLCGVSYWTLRFYSQSDRTEIRFLLIIAMFLILVSLTRSLYPPFWSLITLILIIGLKYWKEKEKQKKKFSYLGIAVITGLILMLWPIKNLYLFGQFTSTSWTGFNLSRGTTVPLQVIKAYQKDGTVPDNILSETRKFEREHGLEFPSPISQIEKSTGGRNYNHYLFLIENPDLSRSAIIYRIVNPLHWVKRTLEHYLVWTQPSHHFYLKPAVNPAQENQIYQFYNQVFNKTIFFDLRPGINSSVLGSIPLPNVFLMDEDLPFTLFGLVIFPLTMVFGGWKVHQYIKTGSIHKGQYLIVIIFIILWVLILPCLTDGFESNRMRFPILPFLIYIIILGLKDIWDKILSYLQENKPKTNQT